MGLQYAHRHTAWNHMCEKRLCYLFIYAVYASIHCFYTGQLKLLHFFFPSWIRWSLSYPMTFLGTTDVWNLCSSFITVSFSRRTFWTTLMHAVSIQIARGGQIISFLWPETKWMYSSAWVLSYIIEGKTLCVYITTKIQVLQNGSVHRT